MPFSNGLFPIDKYKPVQRLNQLLDADFDKIEQVHPDHP